MSRRAPNPAADRAAQNQQTIKTLLKLEGNKSCADCKRNKHPRWASWNLGIFVCIRCSGIHRGMGTHISRVKSVDLDAWTDEQLQSVLRWGNTRANKYWEAKLAVGHVPSEAKIENFIRTKYESKRWVMDGPMPDPATLDIEGDDNMPLNIVKEKAHLDRSASQRASSTSSQPPAPMKKPPASMDILGDVPTPPARPSTTEPASRAPPPRAPPSSKPQAKQGDSLLGLDFLGESPSAPADRPSSASGNTVGAAGQSRPDLKQSILSLYASAPKPQPQPQHDRQSSFGGMQSPPMQSPPVQQSSFGGLNDAFGGLTFSTATSPPINKPEQQKADPFANFSNPTKQRSTVAPPQLTSPSVSGGGFFDTTPKPVAKPTSALGSANKTPQESKPLGIPNDDFGDFSFAASPPKAAPKASAGSASTDLFGLSNLSAPTPAPASQKPSSPSINLQSAFNLSAPTAPPPKPASNPSSTTSNIFSGFSSADAWGSNDAWATPDPAPAPKAPTVKPPSISAPSSDFALGATSSANGGFSGGGFGTQNVPKVAAAEDFGGWSSAAPVSPQVSRPPASNNSKPSGGGFGGSDDLFSNVWE